jgi:hypothetical protein
MPHTTVGMSEASATHSVTPSSPGAAVVGDDGGRVAARPNVRVPGDWPAGH